MHTPLENSSCEPTTAGRNTIHFTADSRNIELMLRTFHSANQLSVYGAVSSWCIDLTETMHDQTPTGVDRSISEESDQQSNELDPQEVGSMVRNRPKTEEVAGNCWHDHLERFHRPGRNHMASGCAACLRRLTVSPSKTFSVQRMCGQIEKHTSSWWLAFKRALVGASPEFPEPRWNVCAVEGHAKNTLDDPAWISAVKLYSYPGARCVIDSKAATSVFGERTTKALVCLWISNGDSYSTQWVHHCDGRKRRRIPLARMLLQRDWNWNTTSKRASSPNLLGTDDGTTSLRTDSQIFYKDKATHAGEEGRFRLPRAQWVRTLRQCGKKKEKTRHMEGPQPTLVLPNYEQKNIFARRGRTTSSSQDTTSGFVLCTKHPYAESARQSFAHMRVISRISDQTHAILHVRIHHINDQGHHRRASVCRTRSQQTIEGHGGAIEDVTWSKIGGPHSLVS